MNNSTINSFVLFFITLGLLIIGTITAAFDAEFLYGMLVGFGPWAQMFAIGLAIVFFIVRFVAWSTIRAVFHQPGFFKKLMKLTVSITLLATVYVFSWQASKVVYAERALEINPEAAIKAVKSGISGNLEQQLDHLKEDELAKIKALEDRYKTWIRPINDKFEPAESALDAQIQEERRFTFPPGHPKAGSYWGENMDKLTLKKERLAEHKAIELAPHRERYDREYIIIQENSEKKRQMLRNQAMNSSNKVTYDYVSQSYENQNTTYRKLLIFIKLVFPEMTYFKLTFCIGIMFATLIELSIAVLSMAYFNKVNIILTSNEDV